MRRIILLIMLSMCAQSLFAVNEEVAAISYNPARLGAYEKLIAFEQATFNGGVRVEHDPEYDNDGLYIQTASNGTVTLRDEDASHKCTGTACAADNLNRIENIGPVDKNTATKKTSTNMPNTIVQKHNNGSPYIPGEDGYQIDDDTNQPSSAQGTDVKVYSGEFSAEKDSFIGSFDNSTVKQLGVTAKTINVAENVADRGNFYAKESFKLGGVEITGPVVSPCNGGLCKEYAWVERYPDQEDTAVQVLAVKIKN